MKNYNYAFNFVIFFCLINEMEGKISTTNILCSEMFFHTFQIVYKDILKKSINSLTRLNELLVKYIIKVQLTGFFIWLKCKRIPDVGSALRGPK